MRHRTGERTQNERNETFTDSDQTQKQKEKGESVIQKEKRPWS